METLKLIVLDPIHGVTIRVNNDHGNDIVTAKARSFTGSRTFRVDRRNREGCSAGRLQGTLFDAGQGKSVKEGQNADIEARGLPEGVQTILKAFREIQGKIQKKLDELQAVMSADRSVIRSVTSRFRGCRLSWRR